MEAVLVTILMIDSSHTDGACLPDTQTVPGSYIGTHMDKQGFIGRTIRIRGGFIVTFLRTWLRTGGAFPTHPPVSLPEWRGVVALGS